MFTLKSYKIKYPHKAILLKTLIILMVCGSYGLAFADSLMPLDDSILNNTVSGTSTSLNSMPSQNIKSKGVCVFDIDFTLLCPGAAAAVKVCKDSGFDLAINTARNKQDAWRVLNDGTLIEKGFSREFVNNAFRQQGLKGPFQYKEDWYPSQSTEQYQQNKSYGMRMIANHYKLKTDDVESRKLVLFDDMLHNIIQMQPAWYEGYSNQRCKFDANGLCFTDYMGASYDTEFPRNWKIYRSKYVGHFCARWWSSSAAASDAREMIAEVLNNKQRVQNY